MKLRNGGIIGPENIPSLQSASGMWTLDNASEYIKDDLWPKAIAALYVFTSFTFTNGTQTGSEGPSLQNLLDAYDTNENPWLENTEFFNTNNGIQLWTVPTDGTYRIKAFGARMFPNREQGAVIQADVSLISGDVLYILVGQEGSLGNSQPGAGGGTWVTKVDPNGDDVSFSNQKLLPVIVAGGAGNGNGVTSTSGGGTAGGINGNGGNPVSWSGSGGGWFTRGADAISGAAKGGEAFIDGGIGGEGNSASTGRIENRGGFGGGGGSSGTVVQGGGGYSGGGNGGGGSFIIEGATNVATSDGNWTITGNEPHAVYSGSATNLNEYNDGHGKVEITFLE